jgi:hypothetical protein
MHANEHERKHWDLCHQIVGVFYSVYNELGYGFLLRATETEVGLLLNFGPKPQFKRFVFENNKKGIRVHSRAFAAKQ